MEEKRPIFPTLDTSLQTDVCVVGAGMAGLITAYLLAKEGYEVVVIEQGEILSGETGRTTAHFVNALDDRYVALEKYHGKRGAQLAAESHTQAIGLTEKIVRDLQIDCDFARVPGYLFLTPGEPMKLLADELGAIRRAGLTDVTMTKESPLPFYDLGRCIHFPNQAQLHPVKYLCAVAQAIVDMNGKIYTHTRARQIQDQPLCVDTRHGHTIHAQHIVVATNSPMRDNVQIYGKQAPYRTYVIGADVPKGSVPLGLYWDTGPYTHAGDVVPYHYVRSIPGTKSDMLISGGEDHRSGHADDAEHRFWQLEDWTKARFPMLEKIMYRWSGQVMEPYDGLGLIGKLPGTHTNMYVITGDSGNGMTHGTLGAVLISDLIAGRENRFAKLYDPSRLKLRASSSLIQENIETATDLAKDWLGPGEAIEDIKPDSGAVIRQGLSKVAVYREPSGKLHACSAVCPHRGCIVRWNSFEKSWDCPCHGSRYDAKGKMIAGPASVDLPIVNLKKDMPQESALLKTRS